MNPSEFIGKRQQGSAALFYNAFGLPPSFISEATVALLTPPALSIMVFLRHKLGYRLMRPLVILTLGKTLLGLALIVNLLAFGWLYLKKNTGLGDTIHSMHVRSAMSTRVPLNDRPAKENWRSPGLPDNWWDLTQEQRQVWFNQHRQEAGAVLDPINKRFDELKAKEDAEDQKIMAAMDKEAKFEKERPYLPHLSLFLFAAGFLWLGKRRREEGGRLIRQGWHSMSRGESYLARWKPLVNEYYLQAYYEPAVALTLGFVLIILGLLEPRTTIFSLLWPFSVSLGLWLMVAAVCLSLSEIALMDIAVNDALDRHDGEVESRQNVDIRAKIHSSSENEHVADHAGVRRGAMFDPETAAYLQARAAEQS